MQKIEANIVVIEKELEDFYKMFRVFHEQKQHLKWAYKSLSQDIEIEEIIYYTIYIYEKKYLINRRCWIYR